jgi:hypothetical protein
MAIRKLPEGTRGTRTPPRFLSRAMTGLMVRIHRRGGDRFNGMDLLYLTTVGAKSGQRRTTPMARYHNVAAHPDQVWAEVSGTSRRVEVEQLEGEARDRAWATVTERVANFKAYETKTDRELPILRLTPVGS